MEKKKLTAKQKVLRVLFGITFIPYVIVLLSGVDGLIHGYTFFSTHYEPGIQAALETAAFAGIVLCYFPIIPICLLIQLAVLANFIIKKKHKKFPTKIFAIVIGIIGVIGAGIVLCNIYEYDIDEFVDGIKAEAMYKKADEVVYFNDHIQYGGGIFNNDNFPNDTLMYIRDEHKIGIVSGGTFDDFNTYELKPMSLEYIEGIERNLCDDPILTYCELSNGDWFVVYRSGESYSTLVKLLVVCTKDGEYWGYEFEGEGRYLQFSNGSFND